jgi:hypothetical protein
MSKKNYPEIIALLKYVWRFVMPAVVLAGLVSGLIIVNLIVDTSPQTVEIKRAQELAIIHRQAERDRADFERLRKKHGLAATAVVIYEPGETPYYYGSANEKIALK